jgi:hypothetical protein
MQHPVFRNASAEFVWKLIPILPLGKKVVRCPSSPLPPADEHIVVICNYGAVSKIISK